ncbi:hypothetical protein [uncultured Bradyrhizobium sp.]|uniref:Uncharacterized protein n=1 Tax=Candidatus Afipia apatlaquensis TaxID=2712852 RepID=A0A7C9RJP0_9BRAD|nr:hypothetical protein [uncultured Bradyrhizobium sp.]NGX96356.1 hypothetical protein [Candidatus Afipia apatlaquensis]
MTVELVPGPGPAAEDHHVRQRAADDFQEGYEAGYNARAEHRTVLGSPAYRQGHAYGVEQRASERRAAAYRVASGAGRLWRGVIIGLVLGLLLGWGLVGVAKADTLADWQQLNELCQGGSGATSDKACAQRSRTTAQLRREGWFEGAHGVWVSPEHVATFNRIMRSYDAIARENTGMLDKVMEGMMTDLRRALPPEAIFALWNGGAGTILTHTPYAASMLMYGLPYLERMLSGKNDPRFVMVLRP